MKKFTKQAKNSKLNEFYFGEYDELDVGISFVKSDTKAPFKMVVFNTEKDNQDKIIVD